MKIYGKSDIRLYEELSGREFKDVTVTEMCSYMDGIDRGIEEIEKINEEITKNLCAGVSCGGCPFDIGNDCGMRQMINHHIDKLKGRI